MIYITGDCHTNFERFNKKNFPEQAEMTKDDYVIITGDFGGVWNRNEESKSEKWILDWLEERPFTTLFVCGNHENFDRLEKYPVEMWNGGKVHKIRPSIIHLMRGQIYELDGKKVFAFGGARSHDINAGILDPDAPDFKQKKKRLDRWRLPYRINHVSWWEQEMPSEEEMEEGRRNLAAHNNKVDYIVTHCCSTSTQNQIDNDEYKPDFLTDYLEEVKRNTEYKYWLFGHYHDNKKVTEKEILLYEQLVRL